MKGQKTPFNEFVTIYLHPLPAPKLDDLVRLETHPYKALMEESFWF